MLFLVLALQAEAPAGAQAVADPLPVSLKGLLSIRYRFRRTGDADDNDLYETLQLRWGEDPVSAALSLRLAADLDRSPKGGGADPFASLDDTYAHAATARVYAAYVDVRPAEPLRVRAGRQVLDELPEALPLDGALLQLAGPVELAVFGGVPVNLFESSSHGDLTYGGWAATSPWARARLRADYLHLEDENVFGAFDDDLIGASIEQGSGPFLFRARHTWLEREGREAVAQLSGLGLDLRARYAYERQQALSYALDPYATFLFDVQPYLELAARAAQPLGRHVAVGGAVAERRLVRGGEEGPYNREFTRWTLDARVDGWPWDELSLGAAADFWDADADAFWTAGGDATLRLHARLALGAGTSYALYEVDVLTGEERERVRTVYGTLRWTLEDGTRLSLRFSHEKDDLDTWKTLEVGLQHAF